MNVAQLRTEIETGPLAAELAPLVTAGDDVGIAAVFNRADIAATVPTMATDRLLMDKLDALPANVILFKLTQASTPAQGATVDAQVFAFMVGRALARLYGDGLDIGNANTLAQLDVLQTNGVLTADEVTAIKGLSASKISRAQQLGTPIDDLDVRRALWNDDGSKAL